MKINQIYPVVVQYASNQIDEIYLKRLALGDTDNKTFLLMLDTWTCPWIFPAETTKQIWPRFFFFLIDWFKKEIFNYSESMIFAIVSCLIVLSFRIIFKNGIIKQLKGGVWEGETNHFN